MTIALTTVFVAICFLVLFIHDRPRYSRNEVSTQAISMAIATPVFALGASLLTVPAMLFISGEWHWPFASWLVLLQLITILPAGLLIPFWIGYMFSENQDGFRDKFSGLGLGLSLVSVFIVSPIAISGYFLISGIWTWPVWAFVLAGLVIVPPIMSFAISHLIAINKKYEYLADNIVLIGVFIVPALTWPIIGTISLVFISGSFWFLLLIPLALMIISMFSLADDGGGYNSGPVISWFISN